ncbi:Alg9-like mannosyltransferase family-domain-containing protein [Dendryphion nanum]|uniref:Mannosyltransferase n=1 Tax=Dendryphion nanum TaxID=256645 RepID=A0A9P9IIX5_9PLEO|nr:Alg9-like mannosyltransferase family-domain-containing protein [Dendryphion nanum]
MAGINWLFYSLIPAFVLIHLFISPYTKVEESFNIQAVHDILIHGIPDRNAEQFFTANYDHISFPGSVPRTFVGALILSGLSRPWVGGVDGTARLQLLVRGVLGLSNAAALVWFGKSVQRAFGTSAGAWFALLQASQFHVMYYASRTLPNMFAFLFSTIALRGLMEAYANQWDSTRVSKNYRLSLYLLTFSGVVFRSELAILVATTTLYLFATGRASITKVILPAGLGGLFIGLLCTVPIDSFFWQSFPLWPEWTGFYYNTIQGHSTAWGVSPWHFYFANALPRLMLNPLTYLVCIPLALFNPATRSKSLDLLVPSLSFIAIYSFLPHKEWRFILYVIPGFTATAAAGASWIWNRRTKSIIYAGLSLALVGSVLVSFVASTLILGISSLNYPGGEALDFLQHQIPHPPGQQYQVYLDNLACQTGVTRFLENHDGAETVLDVLEAPELANRRAWAYSKVEDPETLLNPTFWAKFDYVLTERPEKIIGAWEVIHIVYGFGGIRVLRPGTPSEKLIAEEVYHTRKAEIGQTRVTSDVAEAWKVMEQKLRPLLLGWWVEVRMEPKIRILANHQKFALQWQ